MGNHTWCDRTACHRPTSLATIPAMAARSRSHARHPGGPLGLWHSSATASGVAAFAQRLAERRSAQRPTNTSTVRHFALLPPTFAAAPPPAPPAANVAPPPPPPPPAGSAAPSVVAPPPPPPRP